MYAALAYGPELDPGEKVKELGEDPLFSAILSTTTNRSDKLFDSRDPEERVRRLESGNPGTSALYYYQVRNNLTHRGKGAWQDGERVRLSLLELLTRSSSEWWRRCRAPRRVSPRRASNRTRSPWRVGSSRVRGDGRGRY